MAHDYHPGVEGTNLASLVLGDLVLLVLVALLGAERCHELLSFWSDCANKINVNVVRAPKSDSKLVRSQRDRSCCPGRGFHGAEIVSAYLRSKRIAGCIHCGLLLESSISSPGVASAGFATHSLFNADFYIACCENPVKSRWLDGSYCGDSRRSAGLTISRSAAQWTSHNLSTTRGFSNGRGLQNTLTYLVG